MLDFLAWLWDQATRVYNLVYWLYDKIIDAAYYAYWWAVDEARSALGQAKAFALELRDKILATVNYYYNQAVAWASYYYNQAIAWVVYYYNAAVAWASAAIAGVWADVTAWVNGRLADLYSLIDAVWADITAWVAARLADIQASIDELLAYSPLLASLQTLLTPANLARLSDTLGRLYGTLAAFVSNPLGWTYSMLRSTFVTFASFAVAYSLGTVEVELPPWPLWGGGGPYPVPPGPSPIPYPPSGLVAPLSHLSISGYVFGPGHRGLDLAAINGEPIYAMHTGLITEAGWSAVGYGNDVVVSGDEWWSRYAHAEMVEVEVGQAVAAGTVIALANSTGNSTGPHLHLEIKRGGVFVDPVTVLPIG
jgi:murein DD-endopeptidase MepM/ murein hydrolase activator NlpD